MLRYLKYLVQLLLSPSTGWEDVASTADFTPAEMFRRGFMPLLALTALPEFTGLLYNKGLPSDVYIIRAVIDLGAYYVSFFIARVIFDASMPRLAPTADAGSLRTRSHLLMLLALGEMLLINIVCNLLQAEITILKFLPVYVILILYKGAEYIGVKADSVMAFTLESAGATVAVPLVVSYLLSAILL